MPISPEDLFAVVRNELGAKAEGLSLDSPITALGDSLDWINLISAVEERFDISLEPEQLEGVKTVADLLARLPEPGRT